jgi:hypothetical protein
MAGSFGFLPRIANNRVIGFGRDLSGAGASFDLATSDRRSGVGVMS